MNTPELSGHQWIVQQERDGALQPERRVHPVTQMDHMLAGSRIKCLFKHWGSAYEVKVDGSAYESCEGTAG